METYYKEQMMDLTEIMKKMKEKERDLFMRGPSNNRNSGISESKNSISGS
jgi:hypothetical protein